MSEIKPEKEWRPSKELIEMLYWDEKHSVREVAGIVDMSPTTLRRLMDQYGIRRRRQFERGNGIA